MATDKELAKASASMLGLGCMIFLLPVFAIMIGIAVLALYAVVSSV